MNNVIKLIARIEAVQTTQTGNVVNFINEMNDVLTECKNYLTNDTLKIWVNEQVKLYHKTATSNDFDNGKFWAFKEVQERL